MTTLLSALAQALERSAAYHQGEVAPPVCILWPDPEEQWTEAVTRLAQTRPVLTLGQYQPEQQRGPAIWIRTALLAHKSGLPPVVYLPGVKRSQLRGLDPDAGLQPLIELQYRGVTFAHPNGKSWTPAAFLQNAASGLNIEVPAEAHAELRRQLPLLLDQDTEVLRQQAPISSRWLRAQAYPDLGGSLLRWLNTAGTAPADETFHAAVQEIYGVSLTEGPLPLVNRLASRAGPWKDLWGRFEGSADTYQVIIERLGQVGPAGGVWTAETAAVFPQINAAAEQALAAALQGLSDVPPPESRAGIKVLEAEHAVRRENIWTKLGHSPLAGALRPLARLAELTQGNLSGETAKELADAYAGGGYAADLALLETLATARSDAALEVLGKVSAPLYRAWLERVNVKFSPLATQGLPRPPSADWTAEAGLAVLFVDGLRFDVASQLAGRLETAGSRVKLDWQFSALPSITPTAKPAVAPQAGALKVLNPEKLTMAYLDHPSTAQVLRQALATRGFTYLEAGKLGDPGGAAWAETGDIDRLGHSEGVRMPGLLGRLLSSIQERIQSLLAAGYREVRVITDHGWLLLPGDLPKAELPLHLTHFRKGRYAMLKLDQVSAYPTAPWTWDPETRVTLALGISDFEAGQAYDHGGATLQECVVPVLRVQAVTAVVPVSITGVRWTKMRCRAELSGAGPGLTVDLRRKTSDPASSLLSVPKAPDAQGQVSLLVSDDDALGEAAMLVVLDGETVVCFRAVVVGGEA